MLDKKQQDNELGNLENETSEEFYKNDNKSLQSS